MPRANFCDGCHPQPGANACTAAQSHSRRATTSHASPPLAHACDRIDGQRGSPYRIAPAMSPLLPTPHATPYFHHVMLPPSILLAARATTPSRSLVRWRRPRHLSSVPHRYSSPTRQQVAARQVAARQVAARQVAAPRGGRGKQAGCRATKSSLGSSSGVPCRSLALPYPSPLTFITFAPRTVNTRSPRALVHTVASHTCAVLRPAQHGGSHHLHPR